MNNESDIFQHELEPKSPILPTPIRCSYERLKDTGVYVIGKFSLVTVHPFIHIILLIVYLIGG